MVSEPKMRFESQTNSFSVAIISGLLTTGRSLQKGVYDSFKDRITDVIWMIALFELKVTNLRSYIIFKEFQV